MSDKPEERKQINFTIIPDEQPGEPRIYANFCSIAHTPFDFTLTFCEVMPLSEKEVKEAEANHLVKAPVRARVVVPVQFLPRSEEHTSELQSQSNLVCRLLLEKKKKK